MTAPSAYDVFVGTLVAANVFMAFDAYATDPNIVAFNLAIATLIAMVEINAE